MKKQLMGIVVLALVMSLAASAYAGTEKTKHGKKHKKGKHATAEASPAPVAAKTN